MYTSETNVILIVDDTPTNLDVLSEALTEANFEVAVATSGENAIRQIEYDPPDLILLDVMMPGINGFETCRRLKTNPTTRDIPIVFMTALNDTVDKVKGLSLGAVDYITKPFQQAEVLARIQIHLQLRNMRVALEKQNLLLKQEIAERIAAQAALQKLTQELEVRVAERTKELSQALHAVEQAQVKLVHGEKLATLGQLVAGVAHEINNPVNFIYANIPHASNYIQELLEFMQLYQTQFPYSTPAIEEKSREIDLEFLSEDLPRVLSSMEVGCKRISEIVQSLRNFSRYDEAELKFVDIHEGIESTLTILGHRLKTKLKHPPIEIIKEYGNLPPVECYAGKINQVFMNILTNAIDALEEAMEVYHLSPTILYPKIWIYTELMGSERVAIRIADNGLGISEEVQKRLFDPFFTTKPAGKGTGLGMSISYQIVTEQHGGLLWCISSPGKGAEFLIEIPIKRPVLPDNNWQNSPDLTSTHSQPLSVEGNI
ncbi:MAG: response regulator [Gloeotrichia echinulata IR180]|jgi:signal transduction histidine kinase